MTVPPERGLRGRQDVYLSLTDGQNRPVLPPVRTVTVTLPSVNEVVPIHAVQVVEFGPQTQRIAFQFQPETTLPPGLYRAAVYTKDAYLGAVDFRFRDSFWFF